MTSIATTVIVVGVLFAVAGWLASPTGSARASRRALAPVLRDHVAYVYTGLAIVVCIYFLSAPTQGLRSFLTTLIVAGMAAFGIHELRKQTAEEYPDAELQRHLRPHPRQVVSAVKGANIGERVGEQASKLRLPEVRRPSAEGAPRAEEPPTAVAADDEDARLAAARAAGLAARQGHPHRRGVRRREGPPAGRRPSSAASEAESPPPGSNRQPPDYKSGALPG